MTATITTSAERFYEMGVDYLDRARIMSRPGKEAKTVLLYSVISMAIENMCMALLIRRNTMPMNHSMLDFIYALEQCGLMNHDIKEGMMKMEAILDLYHFESDHPAEPSFQYAEEFIETACKVHDLAEVDMKVTA